MSVLVVLAIAAAGCTSHQTPTQENPSETDSDRDLSPPPSAPTIPRDGLFSFDRVVAIDLIPAERPPSFDAHLTSTAGDDVIVELQGLDGGAPVVVGVCSVVDPLDGKAVSEVCDPNSVQVATADSGGSAAIVVRALDRETAGLCAEPAQCGVVVARYSDVRERMVLPFGP